MGSDPQYAKYPNLSLAQDIFTLTNSASSESSRHASLQKLKNAISDQKMAPLYRQLAHPLEGVLNASGEGSARTSLGAGSRKANGASNILGSRKGTVDFEFPWDEQLYEKLKADNEQELETFGKEEEEAAEKAGDTEVQAAKGKRAEFWARVGDKVQRFEVGILVSKILISVYRKKLFLPTRLSSKRLACSAQKLTLFLPLFVSASFSATKSVSRRMSIEQKPWSKAVVTGIAEIDSKHTKAFTY